MFRSFCVICHTDGQVIPKSIPEEFSVDRQFLEALSSEGIEPFSCESESSQSLDEILDKISPVTIIMHRIITKVLTKRKKGKGMRCDICKSPKMETYCFVAVGSEEDIKGPNKFKYADAFTVWEAHTVTIFTRRLTGAIKVKLDKIKLRKMSNLAEHLVFFSQDDSSLGIMELDWTKDCVRILNKSSGNLLSYWAHSAQDEPLEKTLEADPNYTEMRDIVKQAHAREPILRDILNTLLFDKFYNKYFNQECLPVSYVWPTIHCCCEVLPTPNQIGTENRLYSKYEPGAHYKFCRPQTKARVISREDVAINKLEIELSIRDHVVVRNFRHCLHELAAYLPKVMAYFKRNEVA